MTTPLDLALSYASHNWPLFPCRAADEETGEHDPLTGEIIVLKPKTPHTVNGLNGATRNQALIKRFWAKHPNAMVGVPTGYAIGAFVLDVDIKTLDDGTVINGHESLAALVDQYGPLPETATVTTPRGGRHHYFRHVPGFKNTADKIAPGLDTRAEGGFVVAAGSVMADGRGYEWLDWDGEGLPPIADAPAWLIDLLTPKAAPPRTAYTYQANNDNEPYVTAAVDAELSDLASMTAGRGSALNRAAFSLGTLVGADVLSRHEAEDGLYTAAAANGVLAKDGEKSTLSRIKRGLDAGSRQPRAVPERQGGGTPIVGLGRLVKKSTSTNSPKPVSARVENIPLSEIEPPAAEQPDEPSISATPYTFKDPRTLSRREFAFGTHYIRKYVSVTVSPGGLGKTSNSIVEALSMVSGRDLTGIKPPARLKCWLFNAEDPRDEMERRIQAVCLHYKLKPTDINGHLFLDTGREQDLVIAIDDKRGVKIQMPIVQSVVDQIKRNSIDVMIVDPFVSTHQVNENDNGAIDKVAKLWAQIADDTNCSIDIVHHLRKVADREATVEDARGAVSLIGAARSVRVLNRMSEEQATAAGVAVHDRFSYFNIHQGKANLTKMSTSQDWRKMESVPLGNGTTWKPQDFAGVVTEWKWPSAEEAVGDVGPDKIEQIKVRVANTDCKLHSAADNWVGREVAYVLGLDIAIKADKARVARLVKAWIDDGTFVVVNRRCPIKRENKDFVEVAEAA